MADIIDLELLRSVEWMEAVECTDGAVIWFDLEEMGLHGWAEVVRVEPCPPIKAGPGRLVLATVTHYNSFLMDLRLAGVSEPLHLTDRHRLFSATRQAWIPASDLRAGEDLATRSGNARIQSVSAAPGTHRVFNIEAESEHCFFAGSAEVLSHNTEPCGGPKNGETSATAYGRKKHVEHDYGPGFEKEVDIGGGNRVDALKIEGEKGFIKELKPDNARQRRSGEKRLERYKAQLLKKFPEVKEVETVLETYPPLTN